MVLTKIRNRLTGFASQNSGAAAVEFALVLPIMLTLYLGTMELSQGIEVNKKAGRASSLVADLITQQPVVTKAELAAIADIASATLQPYNRATPKVEMMGIQITNENPPRALVAWSMKKEGASTSQIQAVGQPTSVPSRLMIPGTFIVKGGLSVAYLPITTYTIKDTTSSGGKGIDMGEVYYLRPRASPDVVCTDC